mgnify:FL=1
MFYEIVVAPKYTEKGLQVLKGKSKTLRILEARKQEKGKHSLRQVGGGWLLQEADDVGPDGIDFTTVTEKTPTEQQIEDAKFAWLCVKHVKSNAIVVAKVYQTLKHNLVVILMDFYLIGINTQKVKFLRYCSANKNIIYWVLLE